MVMKLSIYTDVEITDNSLHAYRKYYQSMKHDASIIIIVTMKYQLYVA